MFPNWKIAQQYIVAIILVWLLLVIVTISIKGCGSDSESDPCILPSGDFQFIFSEIEGDCGPIQTQRDSLRSLYECTDISEQTECSFYVYDECQDFIQEFQLMIVNDDKVEGIYYLETYYCSGLYQLTGVK